MPKHDNENPEVDASGYGSFFLDTVVRLSRHVSRALSAMDERITENDRHVSECHRLLDALAKEAVEASRLIDTLRYPENRQAEPVSSQSTAEPPAQHREPHGLERIAEQIERNAKTTEASRLNEMRAVPISVYSECFSFGMRSPDPRHPFGGGMERSIHVWGPPELGPQSWRFVGIRSFNKPGEIELTRVAVAGRILLPSPIDAAFFCFGELAESSRLYHPLDIGVVSDRRPLEITFRATRVASVPGEKLPVLRLDVFGVQEADASGQAATPPGVLAE